MSELSELSPGALILRSKGAAERLGKLQFKSTLAALLGVTYAIPPELVSEEEECFGELFKRLNQA